MKKKLLFVIPSLDAGGGEKSLINLLNTIDFDSCEVDLLLFQRRGLFLSGVPKQVNISSIQGNYVIFTSGLVKSCLKFLGLGRFDLIINRIIYSIKNKFILNKGFAEQSSWENLSKSIQVIEKKYDTAIGFLEKSSNYFVVEKVNATQKIGWIHTNYSKSGMKASFDFVYFSALDHIISVSTECHADLKANFPTLEYKFKIIHNIVSTQLIRKLAEEKPSLEIDWTRLTIITVARLSYEKGCDIAVEACRYLIKKGLDVQWLLIGEGVQRKNLVDRVNEYGIQNRFLFLGLQENPYPFVKKSLIYVQPSRYEGKSIAIDEAKILQKPIVVSDFETAKDQVLHLKNGIISSMCAMNLAEEIFNLCNNTNLRNHLIENLSVECLNSEHEIKKLYALTHD